MPHIRRLLHFRRLHVELLEDRRLLSVSSPTIELFSTSPATFVENQGQWEDESVRYAFFGDGANVLHTDSGPVFQLFQREEVDGAEDTQGWLGQSEAVPQDPLQTSWESSPTGASLRSATSHPSENTVTHTAQFSVHFDGANAVEPTGFDQAETVYNYFIGDESNWQSNVPSFGTVGYPELYDGIDLYTWGRRDSLKYEFHVAPGADYQQIEVSYEGIDGLWIDDDGALHVQPTVPPLPLGEGWGEGSFGELVDEAPYIYQLIDGQETEVAGRFELIDADTYTFVVTGNYDPNLELILDPDLAWSTYLGGSFYDWGYGIAVDAAGNTLVTGVTWSTDFSGRNNSRQGLIDAFVAKVSPSGALAWATYLGGSDRDLGYGIAVDAAGNALVTGTTDSTDFPGRNNAHRGGGWDAFVAKVFPNGALAWSTYLGGSGGDKGYGIAVDAAGNTLVTGDTGSNDFLGRNNAHHGGGWDAFVAKVSLSGALTWATYLGGSGRDLANGIAVDAAGNALVTGTTESTDFSGQTDAYHGGYWDAFVAKVSLSGALNWATYLGGTDSDKGYGIALDAAGNALVTGVTWSAYFPGQTNLPSPFNDAFVAKVSPGGAMTWATYLGGSGGDEGLGIAVDAAGNALVTGETSSTDFPGRNNSHHGGDDYGDDAFVAKVFPNGALGWSTYLGGSSNDLGSGIALDAAGNALVIGTTESTDFLGQTNAYHDDVVYLDAFVAKVRGAGAGMMELVPDLILTAANLGLSPEDGGQRVTATVRNLGAVAVTGVTVQFRDLDVGLVIGTETIATLDAFGSAVVSLLWTPSGPGSLIEVTVDPFNMIEELRQLNNRAVAAYSDGTGPPIVLEVAALHDADANQATFGQFIGGIELYNTFEAAVVDPGGNSNIQRVEFTLGALGTQTDADPWGGWAAEFDVGLLSGDTTLSVVAYDVDGNPSTPWIGTVAVTPLPSWADAQYSAFQGGNAGRYELSGWIPDDWRLDASFPADWLLIGGLENSFQAGVLIHTAVGLDGHVVPSESEAMLGTRFVVFDKELSLFKGATFTKESSSGRPWWVPDSVGFGLDLPTFRPTFDEDLEIEAAAVSLSGSLDFNYDAWKQKWPGADRSDNGIFVFGGKMPFTIAGWPMSLETSLSVSPGIDWSITLGPESAGGWGILQPPTYLTPNIEAALKAKVNLVDVGVASLGAYVTPSLGFNYQVGLLDTVPGFDHDFFVDFQIAVGAEVKVGWWTFNLGEIDLFDYTWGQDYGLAAAETKAVASSQLGTLAMPDMVTLADGRQLVAYVAEDAVGGDTDIVYQIHDAGTWSAVGSISNDIDLADLAPRLGLQPDGTVVAVWTRVELTEAELAAATLDEVLAAQEIYRAEFDGVSWTSPVALTDNTAADGNATVEFATDGTGLAMWTTDPNGTFADGSDNEIAYAIFDGLSWNTPADLTADAAGDRGVDLAYATDGTAVAVWVHDIDAANLLHVPYYATFNGSTWTTPAALPGVQNAEIRSIRVVPLSDGRVVAVWSEAQDDGFALRSMVRDSLGAWSAPETIASELALVDGLQLEVNASDTIFALFHGLGLTEEIVSVSKEFGQAGAAWTSLVPVSNSEASEWMPAGAITEDGDLFVVYDVVAGTGGGGAKTSSPLGAATLMSGANLTFSANTLELMNTFARTGEDTSLWASVVNIGHEISPPTQVQFYAGDPDAGGTPLGSPVALDGLLPDAETMVRSDVFALPPGVNTYYTVIEPVPGEADTGDNSIDVTIESIPPDLTPPQVSVDLPGEDIVPTGTSVLTVTFDEPVISLTETHLSLVEDTLGIRPPDHVYLDAGRTTATLIFEGGLAEGSYTLKVFDSVMDVAGNPLDGDIDGTPGGDFLTSFTVGPAVVGRHVVYNGSTWADPAIATDKVALRPGEVATLDNYTNYVRGINGIVVEIAGFPGAITVGDFEFAVGNDNDPASWLAAAVPTVDVQAGTVSRVTMTWPDNTIQNEWLEVTVLANDNTRLAEPDVFYFGNLIGDSTGDGKVDAFDVLDTRNNPRPFFDPAGIDTVHDFNRDKRVNAVDTLIARNHQTWSGNELALIDLSQAQAGKAVDGGRRVGLRSLTHPTNSTHAANLTHPTNSGKLDWLFEFEQAGARPQQHGRVERAVDQLLAVLGE